MDLYNKKPQPIPRQNLDMQYEYNDSIFSQSIHINAGDVDPKGELSLGKLMLLFQDQALLHYTTKAQTWDELFREKKSWVLNKIELDIKRLPKLSENIKLATWSQSVNQFKGLREFEMHDKDGNILLTCLMSFIYFDFEKKTPVVFDRSKVPGFTQNEKSNFGHLNAWRLETPTLESSVQKKSYGLRISDFDINNHVNNIIYFDLINDFAQTSLGLKKISNIRAIYKKEVPFGVSELLAISSPQENHLKESDKNEKSYNVALIHNGITYFIAEVF